MIPKLTDEGALIVDVRSEREFSAAANSKSINIPLHKINSQLDKLDKNKTIILCCASGARSGMALRFLKEQGFAHLVNAGPWENTLQDT